MAERASVLQSRCFFYLILKEEAHGYSDCDRRGDHPDLCGSARNAGSTVIILYAVRLLAAFLPSNNSETISTSGNMLPDSIPVCRLSPACWETAPTRLGPNAPPRSPAIARKANNAVPPRGRRGEMMLIVPGHMIATENPQKMQPIRPGTGLEDREASR